MGNDQPKAQDKSDLRHGRTPRSSEPDPPLSISRQTSLNERHYSTSVYEYQSPNRVVLESVRNRWQAIQELPTDRVCKPYSIELKAQKRLFSQTYTLEVQFEAYEVSLATFSASLNKNNPLVPEVCLANVLSDCTAALEALSSEALKHGNISPFCIFQIGQDHWSLAIPKSPADTIEHKVNLGDAQLTFLLAPEVLPGVVHNSFLADVFSLGVTVMHCASKFEPQETSRRLAQSDIDKKLQIISGYYSADFVRLLAFMTAEQPAARFNSAQITQYLRDLQDL